MPSPLVPVDRKDRLAAARRTAEELKAVLADRGIELPLLEAMSFGYAPDQPLISLGRCKPQTAQALIAVLKERGARQ